MVRHGVVGCGNGFRLSDYKLAAIRKGWINRTPRKVIAEALDIHEGTVKRHYMMLKAEGVERVKK